jgi:hypothetical protein
MRNLYFYYNPYGDLPSGTIWLAMSWISSGVYRLNRLYFLNADTCWRAQIFA